jgi:NADH-quinone oxidoreductase subunit F
VSTAAPTIDAVLERYPRDPSALIMVLQDLQASLNYLPAEAIDAVAVRLGVPRSRVYSAASFYKALSLEPRGRHQIDVCTGTACHVRGAGRVVRQLSEELGIEPGQTTPDLDVSLDTVHCVGCCALGPVVVMDGTTFGEMTPRKVRKALGECRGRDGSASTAMPGGAPSPALPVAALPPHGTSIPRLTSHAALDRWRSTLRAARAAETATLSICAGSGCRALGADRLIRAFERVISDRGLEDRVRIQRNGCHGFCECGLVCVVRPAGIFYQKLKPQHAREIIERTLEQGEIVEDLLYVDPQSGQKIVHERNIPFYSRQRRTLMRSNALIDPLELADYVAAGGYRALGQALFEMEPEQVIDEVRRAGLRGRGGGGFHAARKWASCRRVKADRKYVLCNADEGDPGAFMDCALVEGNPHAVIEGMVIGAWAVAGRESAAEGTIYVRDEYPVAVAHFGVALEQARRAGLLGGDILGSGFSYEIRISRGGGAFVCGESTALMASIEGKIGEPRAKYVHTSTAGLYGRPTVLNNVESWANVPLIIKEGADAFAAVGTERSKGTKIFSLVGKVRNTGLVEVPMGMTLREIVHEIGGGIRDGGRLKAVQTGGPSGGCVPESLLDLPVDFDALAGAGSMMGSGGMIVMDESTCMVDVARYFTSFLTDESCGKCSACRNGLAQMRGILERICRGGGRPEDLERLETLFAVLDAGSLCGLGKSAANPVRSTLAHFRDEYVAHIEERRCPAGVCRDLVTYQIDASCTGCTLCLDVCPESAISGALKKLHVIDVSRCNRCGLCVATCPFGSIVHV